MRLPDHPPVERIILDRLRLSVGERAQYVRRHAIISTTVVDDDFEKFEADVQTLMLRLESHVLAHQIATGTERHLIAYDLFKFPASPWQFFKQRHADSWWLGWLVRRHPVREHVERRAYHNVVTIGRHMTFPDCNWAFPDGFGQPVMVDVVKIEHEVDRSPG